jgi:ammonia channel protein AmtB
MRCGSGPAKPTATRSNFHRTRQRRHAITLGWSVVVTYVLLKLIGLFVPIRVSTQQELEGLDISQHGEALQ